MKIKLFPKISLVLLLLFCSNSLIGKHRELEVSTKKIDRKLFEAVDEEDKNKIRYLINEGANINAYLYHYNCEQTPIHRALHNESLNIAEFLLNLGANVNSTDEFGETLLQYCSTYKYLNFAKKLIDLGANVNAKRQAGMTALHLASMEKDSIDIIKLLVNNNADIYAKDMFGCPSFVYANDNEEVLRHFLSLNIDVNFPLFANLTVLYFSIFNANEKTVDLLIKNNANVNHEALFGVNPVFLAIAQIIDSNFVDCIMSSFSVFNENNYKNEQSDKDLDKPKMVKLKILELLLKNNADIYRKTQSINEFFNEHLELKQDIENICNNFQSKYSLSELSIENDKFGLNSFYSIILQYLGVKMVIEYGKNDLEVEQERIIYGFKELSFALHYLLENCKNLDLPGYSAYDLIKNNYSMLVELVEKEDANKELTYLRKLLADIN